MLAYQRTRPSRVAAKRREATQVVQHTARVSQPPQLQNPQVHPGLSQAHNSQLFGIEYYKFDGKFLLENDRRKRK
jgi:hypothetical protein